MQNLRLRNGNWDAFDCKDAEVLLAGPAGTGKSLAWLAKIFHNAAKYPTSRHLIARKTRSSLTEAALVSLERDILSQSDKGRYAMSPPNLRRVRQAYHLDNGSEIICGGLDKPEKVLSTEYDTIYVQEATELELEEWETLIGRLRSNRMPYQQIAADCNPTFPHHWLYKRWQSGRLRMLTSVHTDNPAYWDNGDWTEAGQSYLKKLNQLTGFRRKRFLEGVWAAAEGLVFDLYDPAKHLLPDSWTPPKEWPRYHAVDFGYTAPLVYQFWAKDPDGRLHLYREAYKTQYLVEDLAKWVKIQLMTEPKPRAVIGDHDAEDRATFERHSGLTITPADKSLGKTTGLSEMQKRFDIAGDGRPRIFFHPKAVVQRDNRLGDAGKPASTIEELNGYVWDPKKDVPIDENDHGMDAARYLVRFVDTTEPKKTITGKWW